MNAPIQSQMVYLYNIILIILFDIILVRCLVELPQVENNSIRITETIIRHTINNLFASFKIRHVRQKHKLTQYSVIHNFFVSITLKDDNNLKKIARLTRVNNIDDNLRNFVSKINEAIDERETENSGTYDVEINAYIAMFINKLKHLNTIHKYNGSFNINPDILQRLDDGNSLTNVTKAPRKEIESENVITSMEYWKPSSRRIFEGRKVNIKRFPFMASILFFKRFQCSGSLIKSDLVITSSSCLQLAWNNRFYRENPAFLSVRVGSDYCLKGGEEIPIIEIHFHPLYDPKTLAHNIAVMRLRRRIYLKYSAKVKKIDIDRNPEPLSEDDTDDITVLGWGATDVRNIIKHRKKNSLKYANLDYYPLDNCMDVYKKFYISKRHFCAGFISKGGGACNLDGGGPGIINDLLVGIISFGALNCGVPDYPTVFIKIGFYAHWIDEIIEQDVPKTYRLGSGLTTTEIVLEKTTTTKKIRFQPIFTPQSPIYEYDDTINIKEIDFARFLNDDSYFKDYLRTIFKIEAPESKEQTKKTEIHNKFVRKLTTRKIKSKSTIKLPKTSIQFTSPIDVADDSLTKEYTLKVQKKRKHKNKGERSSHPSLKYSTSRLAKSYHKINSTQEIKRYPGTFKEKDKEEEKKSVLSFAPVNVVNKYTSIAENDTSENDSTDVIYRRMLRIAFN